MPALRACCVVNIRALLTDGGKDIDDELAGKWAVKILGKWLVPSHPQFPLAMPVYHYFTLNNAATLGSFGR